MTRHPLAASISRQTCTRIPGITRSRLCRFTSTTQSTRGLVASAGSITASHTVPSSSSASPSVETNRCVGSGASAKRPCTYCSANEAKLGAMAPSPTDPSEKST